MLDYLLELIDKKLDFFVLFLKNHKKPIESRKNMCYNSSDKGKILTKSGNMPLVYLGKMRKNYGIRRHP